MSFENYEGAGEVYLNGNLLAEISECEYQLESNNNDVDTMQKGFAGQSDGPRKVRITWTSAIPKAGHEFDYHDAVNRSLIVRFVFIDGDKRRTSDGKIQSYTSGRSVSSSGTSGGEFRGAPVGSAV